MAQTLDDLARGRIKTWIATTGITQTYLAEQIGENQAWVSRYLSGEFNADLDRLQKIARVFSHTLSALLDSPLDPQEQQLIDAYRALPPTARALVLPLFQHMTQRPHARRRPK
jgi:transcriptional regulator with XRE-family HTH domain